MSNKFNVGNRVILTGKVLIPYPDWPVWGSKHSCVGTIVQIRHGFAHIQWDNGYTKVVNPSSLSYFTGREEKSLSPNMSFMLCKRSKNGKGR